MMRALWSAASGMIAQQTNVDTISHNLSNVNTVGYKTQKAEFKTLLYQDLQARTTTANGETKPTPAQVGLGTRVADINTYFTQGPLASSESNTDFAIDGRGFFAVLGDDGETYYTRNGSFTWAIGPQGTTLCNQDGYPVLDSTGKNIVIPNGVTSGNISGIWAVPGRKKGQRAGRERWFSIFSVGREPLPSLWRLPPGR